jgi:hypothetical protein
MTLTGAASIEWVEVLGPWVYWGDLLSSDQGGASVILRVPLRGGSTERIDSPGSMNGAITCGVAADACNLYWIALEPDGLSAKLMWRRTI